MPTDTPVDRNDTNPASPLLEFHLAAGAECSPYFGVILPRQFDDPVTEEHTARHSAVLVDTNYRAVFHLAGPDRTRYLNAVLTSNVRDLAPGAGTIGLLLNAQGHIQAELETFACEDRVLILGHMLVREKTAATLEKFIIMDDATLTDETAQFGTLSIEGPAAPAIVRELTGVDLAELSVRGHVVATIKAASRSVDCRVIHRSLFGYPSAEFLMPRDDLATLWGSLLATVRRHGGAAMGYRALNSLRLEAGIPWFGTDFDEHQIPHEAALEGTHISFTKGCYTGQEIVERVRSRGHINRRLTGLRFESKEAPEPGAPLLAGGTDGGHVTSAAFSPLAGKAIGLGYVRREQNKLGSALQCGDIGAEVIALPLPSALPAA